MSCFGARYYDAEIGRFISRDPAFDGQNWFVYCANNPLKYVDPNGCKIRVVPYASEAQYSAPRLFNENYTSPEEDLTHAICNEVIGDLRRTISGFDSLYKYLDEEIDITISLYLGYHKYGPRAGETLDGKFFINLSFEDNKFKGIANKTALYCVIEEFVHAYEVQVYLNNPDKEYSRGDDGYTGMLIRELDLEVEQGSLIENSEEWLLRTLQIELLTEEIINGMLDESGVSGNLIPRYNVYYFDGIGYTWDKSGNIVEI